MVIPFSNELHQVVVKSVVHQVVVLSLVDKNICRQKKVFSFNLILHQAGKDSQDSVALEVFKGRLRVSRGVRCVGCVDGNSYYYYDYYMPVVDE
jgi:hypothetical protein